MKKKAPVIVKEYAAMEKEYLAEKGTMEGFEEMVADVVVRQMRALAQQGYRFVVKDDEIVSVITPTKTAYISRSHPQVEELLSIDEELFKLAGSEEAYQRLLVNLGEQMKEVARTRGRIDLKTGNFVPIEVPKKLRKPRSKEV